MRALVPCTVFLVAAAIAGCHNGQFAPAPQGFAWQQQPDQQPYMAQLAELNRRVTELDANNRDLHMQLAQAQQNSQISSDQLKLLQQQLTDTASQLRSTQLAKQEAEKRVEAIQASTRHRGGAAITANSSIKSTLTPITIPGLDVRQDQDVLRIELPADQIFRQSTAQFQPGAAQILDTVADAIVRNFPRHVVAVEGHTDTPPSGATPATSHQLSAAQAYAVFEALASRSRLPAGQMSVVAHGANRPRFSNDTAAGRAKNRRVEIVIYPEVQ
jgi:flagellar motor protein MotB